MTVSRVLQRLALISLFILAGCATGPQISSDTDPQADFSSYRSFAFYAPLAVESKGYATPASSIMRAALPNRARRLVGAQP